MSNDFNSCTFTGRLGATPETRFLPDGKQVTNFNIACGETWKDKEGNKHERVEWVSVVLFGKLAEIASLYLEKGSHVLISGKLKTDTYEKDGDKKYKTKVVAHTMKMLGSRPAQTENAEHAAGAPDDEVPPF